LYQPPLGLLQHLGPRCVRYPLPPRECQAVPVPWQPHTHPHIHPLPKNGEFDGIKMGNFNQQPLTDDIRDTRAETNDDLLLLTRKDFASRRRDIYYPLTHYSIEIDFEGVGDFAGVDEVKFLQGVG